MAMPEAGSVQKQWMALIGFALLATLATGLGGAGAAIAGWLAQPPLALAARGWHRSRFAEGGVERDDVTTLLLLWGGGLLGLGALVAWPLHSLRGGGLTAVLALCMAIGVAVITLWRTWPLWHGVERDGGDLRTYWAGLGALETGAWRGLAAALIVIALLASVMALAWPGLLGARWRWALAALAVPSWPALHLLLQSVPPPAAWSGADDDRLADTPALDDDETIAASPVPPPAAAQARALQEALYEAARGGRVERALELLDRDADPHALPEPAARDQRSLIVLAAVLPDLRLLRRLIALGVDVNAAHAGMTPLLAATRDSWHGRPEAVMTLLANGADPHAADGDGNTPLHHAARSSDPGVAALLRDAAAKLDARNHAGLTPLGVACTVGNWRLAQFLLERGAKTEVEGATPALLAAAGGEDDDAVGVQLLLKHKARPDSRDAGQRSALHEAALAGHLEIVNALLVAGADVQARDLAGRTPLLDAAWSGRLGVVYALLAAQADVDAQDKEGRNALMLASIGEAPSVTVIERLLEAGADPAQTDRAGKRALDLAVEAGRWSLASALDPAYVLPASVSGGDGDDAPDRTPVALLREAIEQQNPAGLDPALARLLGSAELGHLLGEDNTLAWPPALYWLLAHGADPEARLPGAPGPMFKLLARPQGLPMLQHLLDRAVSPAGAGGLARFVGACASDGFDEDSHQRMALDLLERGADPFASSPQGDPALTLAVRLGWDRLAGRLIALGVALDQRDGRGMTALHLAAALGRETALKTLVAHGARPDLRAADGQTPLGVALSSGRRDLADWLDWRDWPLPRRPLRASDLPAAAVVGDVDAVRRLLDLGFAIDAVDAQGCSALLRAAGGGHLATVELLLARGADPQRAANTGATPLSAAVSMRQIGIVDRLLKAGASLDHRLPGEVTVLMLAAALGLPEVCARLLSAGANVQAGDAQGLTPLHCAAMYGFGARDRQRLIALLDTLLLAGAEADSAAGDGVTALLLLLGARAEPGGGGGVEEVLVDGLERLLDEDVSLQARDPRGFGPLHLAALHGLLQVTRFLLRAGADPEQRDALGRTPGEIAVMRGFVDVAREFEPNKPGVSMARFLREPPRA